MKVFPNVSRIQILQSRTRAGQVGPRVDVRQREVGRGVDGTGDVPFDGRVDRGQADGQAER